MSAVTSSSRAWFFPTSPRSPYKLQSELKLLKQLDGRIWDNKAQTEFAILLQKSPEFKGDKPFNNPAFSGRDRATRAPRLLGFVHFPKKGSKGKLRFTAAGNAFIAAGLSEQALIFQRQIAKVQFTSPLHDTRGFEEMSVRPMIVMIRLLLDLESLSKEEVALFAVTLIREDHYDKWVAIIKNYRTQLSKLPAGKRKQFRKDHADAWVKKVYAGDISSGRTRTRQGDDGDDDFVRTKYQTLRDYADSTMRYMRATGLFTITPHGQRLVLLKSGIEDAKFLVKHYSMGLSTYSYLAYDDYVIEYLGNPSLPLIAGDDAAWQKKALKHMLTQLKPYAPQKAESFLKAYDTAISHMEKLGILEQLKECLGEWQVKNEAKKIRSDLAQSFADIQKMYTDITSKVTEVVDRPLMYEWNAWRAMTLINDAINVQAHYLSDADGNPVSTAAGNRPDILVEYKNFWLAVEVTLQSGKKQYETEGEPISRHLGLIQKQLHEKKDLRPIYGLFIAEKINDEVIAHLVTLARYKLDTYKGSIRIIPLERQYFELWIEQILKSPNFSHELLEKFFSNNFSTEKLQMGELDWRASIQKQVVAFSAPAKGS